MKKALSFLSLVLLLSSCLKDTVRHTYTMAVPVYKPKAEVYANIKSNAPREIKRPGKIFLYGNYIFLNEVDKGVHLIDNSDPSRPVQKAFIDIPGNIDIAVKGNTLYADLYTDLVTVDISDPLQAQFRKFVSHVFPERNYNNGFIADSTRIIVDWEYRDTTVTEELNGWGRKDFVLMGGGIYSPMLLAAGGSGGTVTGIAGSMARFSIVGNYLYCLNNWQLFTFGLTNPSDPQRLWVNNLPWNIETLYPFGDKLFIGSTDGMFIYDISNPAIPVQLGRFSHARSCDPVIADGDNAYVTLRSGNACTGISNQLDVLDVRNLMNPVLIRTYGMTNPHGLAKSGNTLFICDGKDGLKVFDASNPGAIVLLKHVTGLETFDAIAWNNNLLVVAKDGLYQYDYSDPARLTQRSKISVTGN